MYGWIATRELDSLVYVSDPGSPIQHFTSAMTLEELRSEASPASTPGVSDTGPSALPDPSSLRLYPGEGLAFAFWAEPWAAESPSSLGEDFTEGFLPVDPLSLNMAQTLPPATRVLISAIDLEADVEELEIQDLGDSRQYETPNRVVGHIPDTANPGEAGNSWLFGHLQSPIRDEGAIFRDLPRIPEMLRTGQRVFVVLDGSAGNYLYEVYETDVVHQDDLRLYDTADPTITLVTCVPMLTYDHRLLVTARLVGFKPSV